MRRILKNIYINLRKCLLYLFAIFFCKNSHEETSFKRSIKKILFIRIDRIGDLILSTPTIKALKEKFPHSELTILASPSNVPVLLNNPFVDRTVIFDRRQKLIERFKIIKLLRDFRFDLSIDPYSGYSIKSAVISFLAASKNRIGYDGYGREVFFNIALPVVRNKQHFVDLTLGILKPLEIITENKKPEIYLNNDEKLCADKWVERRKLTNKPIVGIHPGAFYWTQRWPPTYYADLINNLNKDNHINLLVFGSRGDQTLINKIRTMINEQVRYCITNDLREFIALLSKCKILICNNSGPLHLAVALNIPTISFMGPTIKERWEPIEGIHRILRMDKLSCIGCNSGHCRIKTHDCMTLISPQMAIENSKDLLKWIN